MPHELLLAGPTRNRKQGWYGERRRMDLAWGEHFWREDVSHPYVMKVVSADSYEYTDESRCQQAALVCRLNRIARQALSCFL